MREDARRARQEALCLHELNDTGADASAVAAQHDMLMQQAEAWRMQRSVASRPTAGTKQN